MIQLFFALFNCFIIAISLIFIILSEKPLDNFFDLIPLSIVVLCLFINILYLLYFLISLLLKIRGPKVKKNHYNADTIQKNLLVKNTLPMNP